MSARRRTEAPQILGKDFTYKEIELGIKKLKRRIEEVISLQTQNIQYNDAKVKTAEANIRDTIREVFGQNSPEFNDYQYHDIWHGPKIIGDKSFSRQSKFKAGIPQTISMLEGLIKRLEEKRDDLPESSGTTDITQPAGTTRRIFLVHGHDDGAKETVARFLERLKLKPVILQELPNEGKTIIEKFEKNADVEYAVILLTPDDMGHPKGEPGQVKSRARQNVILELGYFIGRLSRSRVCALHKGDLELPSDIHGVLYIPMDEEDGWELKLAKEIKNAKIPIDMNRVC
jgi:predicted nucleotide-binding protein